MCVKVSLLFELYPILSPFVETR